MQTTEANQVRKGMKVEIDNVPYNVVNADHVKPGKGGAFARIRLKNLKTGTSVEYTFKANEKIGLADVEEIAMRMLYKEADGVVFMNDNTFDQVSIPLTLIGEDEVWLKEELCYSIIFYKGEPVAFTPPTFMELIITETAPGDRGNTASGRVLKDATTETGGHILIPIFVNEGEKVKVDTRTGEYVSRVT